MTGVLMRMTTPMVLGIISVLVLGLVDAWFISRLGTAELAAIGFTFPVTFGITGLSLGVGIGTASLLSRTLGAGHHHQAQRLATDALLLAVVIVAVVSVVGLATIEPLFRLLGADEAMFPSSHIGVHENVLPHITEYMRVRYFGVIFLFLPMLGNAILRSTGDTRTPALIMTALAVVNGVLDPLLIFGIGPFPRLELQGAALANVIAFATVCVASLLVLWRREHLIELALPRLDELVQNWKRILSVAAPAAGTHLLGPVLAGVLTAMVAQYGNEAVAAFGVGSRIEPLALVLVMGLSGALPPVVGQNWGSNRLDRVQEALQRSFSCAMLWQAGVAVALAATAPWVAGLFSTDPAVTRILVGFLWILPLSYGAQGVAILACSTLNAVNMPVKAVALSVFRSFVLFVPLALAGAAWFGINGIFAGGSVANLAAGAVAYVWIRKACFAEARLSLAQKV